jgi:hypothetical protein
VGGWKTQGKGRAGGRSYREQCSAEGLGTEAWVVRLKWYEERGGEMREMGVAS